MATRADVEVEVTNLFGPIMELVGLMGGVADGTNPFLNAPIRDGLQRMGYALSDPNGITVADADIAVLDSRALRRLMEWTSIYILERAEDVWFRAGQNLATKLPDEVLAAIKAKIASRLALLRIEVTKPYQSMNMPLSVGQIRAGSRNDPTLPPGVLDIIPPWALAPDGLWIYGRNSAAYWGLEGWSW